MKTTKNKDLSRIPATCKMEFFVLDAAGILDMPLKKYLQYLISKIKT